MARQHLRAEIVLGTSGEGAVAALGGRVPDVLLMSPLLSQRDETTLSTWLRELGPAAAHVQELSIPMLAEAAPPRPESHGLLRAWRQSGVKTAIPEGCELDHFAREVAAYVQLAATQRVVPDCPPLVEAPPEPEPLPGLAHPTGTTEAADVAAAPPATEAVAAIKDAMVAVDDESSWVAVILDPLCEPPGLPGQEPDQARLPPNTETPPKPALPGKPSTVAKRKRARRASNTAPQDEWGLFDPEQCGFAALVARLDEITEHTDAEQTGGNTTVRLLAY